MSKSKALSPGAPQFLIHVTPPLPGGPHIWVTSDPEMVDDEFTLLDSALTTAALTYGTRRSYAAVRDQEGKLVKR